MSKTDYAEYLLKVQHRTRCFAPYKDDIIACYTRNLFQPLQKSSIYDYLEEKHGKLPGTERALRDYIDYLLDSKTLELGKKPQRPYQSVPELPFGQQLQLDFGEYRTRSGLKLYIFATVLSASRYKYCDFQEKPFTAKDVIEHLLNCFQYLGGQPAEIVIDQDRTMVVSENHGDIIYTEDFSGFIEEMKLRMYVCRKNDPESKGKVENLVKFVKGNFLASRDFADLAEARNRVRKWLTRRANGKVSAATKRIPAALFAEEQKHLQPLRSSIFRKESPVNREERLVDKLCRISVDACKYPVPESYRNGVVEIYRTADRLLVFEVEGDQPIAEYRRKLLPDTKADDLARRERRGQKLDALQEDLLSWHQIPSWEGFVEKNRRNYGRYFRDQYHLARKRFREGIDSDLLAQALGFCLANETYSFSDLFDAYNHFQLECELRVEAALPAGNAITTRNHRELDIVVAKRGLNKYRERARAGLGVGS